jgi:hypothetical protein
MPSNVLMIALAKLARIAWASQLQLRMHHDERNGAQSACR